MAGEGAPRWTVEEYETESGNVPVLRFLEGLRGRDDKEALALLTVLRDRGHEIREPRSKALGGGLYELRGHQVRIFYVFRPGRRIVLLDGMIKKQDRIPAQVLKRVRAYQQSLDQRREEKEESP